MCYAGVASMDVESLTAESWTMVAIFKLGLVYSVNHGSILKLECLVLSRPIDLVTWISCIDLPST